MYRYVYIYTHTPPGRHRQRSPTRGAQQEGQGGQGAKGELSDKFLEEDQDLEEASLLRKTIAIP